MNPSPASIMSPGATPRVRVRLRAKILQYVGISVSIGIASSKVLAKLMTEVVKHHAEYEGVLCYFYLNEQERDAVLSTISVEDIWGWVKKVV